MLTLVRLALRDLRQQRAFSLFFIANLALGLGGSLLLDSLQGSVSRTLTARSQALLGADIRVTSPQALSAEDIARIDAAAGVPEASAAAENSLSSRGVKTSDLVQLYSMVSGSGRARLVELRGIDRHFPLHGALVLAIGGVAGDDARDGLERGDAWADPSLLEQLGVHVGDAIKIGTGSFRIADTLVRDTGLSVRAASLAPRLYVAGSLLAATGLLETGSRVEHQHLVALDGKARAADSASAAAARMRTALGDARVRIISHEEAVSEISGGYSRVTGYLGLVSLVALALAGVASAYLFHAFLRRRLPDLAILMSLGARRRYAQALLMTEVGVLASIAALVAIVSVMLALPAAAWLLADLLPAELALGVGAHDAAVALAVALSVGPVSCLPLLSRLATLRVADLFQEQAHLALRSRPRDVLWTLPAVALLFVLAAERVGNPRHGAWFAAVLLVAFGAAAGAGRVLLPLVAAASVRARVSVRLALRQLSPHRRASRTAFVALTMTALLLGLPPQLRSILTQQLIPPGKETTPSLFLFDIQPEQTGPLRAHLAAAGTGWQRLAPMVRARLLSINGETIRAEDVPAGDAAAQKPSGGFRSGENLGARRYNLTYEGELHTTEKIVAGIPFDGTWNDESGELPEISLEKEFARRLGLALGDRLRFDVQGVEVEGRVVNLREVDWTSLQPNFFVSFQPGVLEAAPTVFLASIPSLEPAMRERLQASIVEQFPNISMIDVTRGVERALGLLTQLRWAVAATAWTALAVGLMLVFAIARDEADERRWDINLMKVLGARHGLLRTSIAMEFATLGAVAALAGCTIGVGASAVLAHGVLDIDFRPAWLPLAAVAVVLPLIAAVTARVAMRRVLRERPLLTLG